MKAASSLHGFFCLALVIGMVAVSSPGLAVDVRTYHNDPQRTGWDSAETILTPSNVASAAFQNLRQLALANQVSAQPLVVSAATWSAWGFGSKFHNDVVFIATEGNDILAIDSVTGGTLLQRNFGTPVSIANLPGQCPNNSNVVGITSTPVIDPATRVMYFMTYNWENNAPLYRLHAINLVDLTDKVAPTVITAQQRLSDGTTTTFNPAKQRQRPALLLSNGNVYAGFGSFCDFATNISRGWVIGWNAATLAPLASAALLDQQTSTQSGGYLLSAVWMSGYGLAADSSGNIYFQTGNSNGNRTNNLPESTVKVNPALSAVVDYFTPANFATLDQGDLDRGAGGVMVVPDQANGTQFAVAGGKEGRTFLLNRNQMGGYVAGGPDVPSNVASGKCWCGPAYFVGSDSRPRIVSTSGTQVRTYFLPTSSSGTLALEATGATLPNADGQDEGFMTSVSSNGTVAGTAMMWSVSHSSGASLYLQALVANSGVGSTKSLTDKDGNVWTFGTQSNSSYGMAILENGTQAYSAWGVQMLIDSSGIIWHANLQNKWYKFTGTGWSSQPGPVLVMQAPAGAAITPTTGVSLTDVNGGVWTFGTQKNTYGNALLLNGVQAYSGWGVKMVIDPLGVIWHVNAQGNWFKYTGSGWAQQMRSPGGATITPTSADSLADANGAIWTFGPQTLIYGNEILRNGVQAYGAWGVQVELDTAGVIWHVNAQGKWYKFTGSGWALQSGPPKLVTRSVAGTSLATGSNAALIDVNGNAWSFGTQANGSNYAVLMNGTQAFGAWGVKIEIDALGVIWYSNSQGAWYKFTGTGWSQKAGAPPIPSLSGTTITTNSSALAQGRLFNAGKWANRESNPNIVPTVANGKVFVPSLKTLTIWGQGQ